MSQLEKQDIQEQSDNIKKHVTLSDSKAKLTNSEGLNHLIIKKIEQRIKKKPETVDDENEINELNTLIQKAIDSFDPVEWVSKEYETFLKEIETWIKPLKISQSVSKVLPQQRKELSNAEKLLKDYKNNAQIFANNSAWQSLSNAIGSLYK